MTEICKIVEAGNHVIYQRCIVPAPTAKSIKVSRESKRSNSKWIRFLYEKSSALKKMNRYGQVFALTLIQLGGGEI